MTLCKENLTIIHLRLKMLFHKIIYSHECSITVKQQQLDEFCLQPIELDTLAKRRFSFSIVKDCLVKDCIIDLEG